MSLQNINERALKISSDAADLGFDWAHPVDVLDKLAEEVAEIRQALISGESVERIAEEVGDLYFALVNFNRKMHIDSSQAFEAGVKKFERRFNALRQYVEQSGCQIDQLSDKELDDIWQQVKKDEGKHGCQ